MVKPGAVLAQGVLVAPQHGLHGQLKLILRRLLHPAALRAPDCFFNLEPTRTPMPQILRYELKTQLTTLHLPPTAVVLSAVPDAGHLNLYVLADLKQAPAEPRHFRLCGTGEPLPEHIWDSTHILSVPGFHLFEVPARFVQSASNAKA
jgi:hypothetical protein